MEEVIVQEPSLFKEFLNYVVKLFAIIHRYIMSLNDKYEMFLSDKMLHFIVIGILGLAFLFVIYPLFKWLIDNHKLMLVSWIYVFTILIAITLLIEIGQDISGTGDMDFADIVSGLLGFIVMSGTIVIVRNIYLRLKNHD
ncbi:MAG: hypothetical protein Q4E33_04065 [Erysipelotrichaceae bacterium]|nr:hypothetical protein [Erysipelotrichaceae bacterium]